MVTLQYLCFVAVTVYVLKISTSTERFYVSLAVVTFLNSIVNFRNSIVNLNDSRPSNDNPWILACSITSIEVRGGSYIWSEFMAKIKADLCRSSN